MASSTQTLRGFRDFLPQQALKRAWLKKKIIGVFEDWGFDPMETPTLEALELFEGQIGEDEKLFFKFQDPGGRDVALRYDQTVPTCRVMGEYSGKLTMPFKRYQIQPAFRAERPQRGRYREFLQCDADIFGSDSPLADAEVIALGLDIYRRLGFNHARVLINDRALLKNMPYEAIVAIDKLKKIGKEGVIEDMIKKGIEQGRAEEYLTTITTLQPNETITVILDYLDKMGFAKDWYTFDPTIARSFSYSTGSIWEIEIPDSKGGSVLGGERFDHLVERIAGVRIPGTGFGLGFDRTLEAAEEAGLIPQLSTNARVLVTIFDHTLMAQSLVVARHLREKGINTEVYPDASTKLGKQLKYANAKHIPHVIVIGPDEATANQATIKNMESGDEMKVDIERVGETLTQVL